MDRRSFLGVLGALRSYKLGAPALLLEALVAPRMPQVLAIYGFTSRVAPGIFELREYRSGPGIGMLHRSGIHPVLYSSTPMGQTYLIPFESLQDRERAWSRFAADPEWVKARKGSMEVRGISLWRQII